MRIKFLLILVLVCVTCAFAYSDGFLSGGNNAGTYYYNEDLSKPFMKAFDVKVELIHSSDVQSIITDKVAVLVAADRIYAYDKSGMELWKYPKDKAIDESITSTAISYNGNVYFTTLKTLFCLDELTGKILWRKNIEQTLNPIFKVHDGVMYIALDDKKVHRINPATGEEVANPIVYKSSSAKNNLLIKDNYLVVTAYDNKLICHDLTKPEKQKYSLSIPATSQGFSPVIFNDYIILTSGEHVILYNLSTGKEITRKKFSPIATSAITNGKNIYVACIDTNIYKLKLDNKLTVEGEPFRTPNVVSNFVAISDDNIIIQDGEGLISTYDLGTMDLVWQFESGMYTAGGVTTSVPGLATNDITVKQQVMTGGGTGGMGGGAVGGRGGRGGRGGFGGGGFPGGGPGGPFGFGGRRAETIDNFATESTLIAQAPFGGPGFGGPGGPGMGPGIGPGGMPGGGMNPGGMPGGGMNPMNPGGMNPGGMNPGGMNPGGMGMTGSTTKTITYVNVLTQNGDMYDVDLEKFYNDPSREFVPSEIMSKPFYGNGYLGYITNDGHYRVRSFITVDNQVPYTFEFSPGSNDTNKTVSAVGDILVKVFVFDKGSGIKFRTANLVATDAKGKEYIPYLIYDPVNQSFYGYIRGEKDGATVNPFPDGDMNCVFTLEDYAGNVLTKKWSFKIDASVAYKEEQAPGSSYFDVKTGKLLEIDPIDFSNGVVSKSDKSASSGSKEGSAGTNVASSTGKTGGVVGVNQGDKKKIM